jgi:hypothetical protein
MHDEGIDQAEVTRRALLQGTLAAGAASLAGRVTLLAAAPARGRIREENAERGTLDWQLSFMRTDPRSGDFRSPLIEGYASRTSVRPGESLDLMVSTDPPAAYTIDVYRLGYYQGLGGRHRWHSGPLAGRAQPTPGVGPQRLRECQWEPSTRLKIPGDWVSGVYLARLTRLPAANNPKTAPHAYQSYIPFIVADERQADLVFQCSDNTWQAYNRWPDAYSLYNYEPGATKPLLPDVCVSFNRPYARYWQIVDAPLSLGSGEFLLWEFPLAFWLEQQGYDVTYVSNVDVHADAASILRGKCLLSVGHDEYWSRGQYAHVAQAISQGVNVAFLSGNTCCFVAPYTPSGSGQPHRTLTRAGRYGGVSAAETAYMGPFPEDGPNEAQLIGARTVSPFNGSGDWTITQADHWLFAGTGLRNGDALRGLVGWEFHGDPAPLPGLEVVASGPTLNSGEQGATFTATIYPGPRGNQVFNAATIFWSEGLSAPPGHIPPHSHFGRPLGPDARVQRITANLLERMTS